MTGLIQPLDAQVEIVDQSGKPTPQFIRLMQKLRLGSGLSKDSAGNITFAAMAAKTILANKLGVTGSPTACTMSDVLDFITSTRGSILYRGAAAWQALAPGTSGNVLQTNGAGADPTWATPAAGGSGLYPQLAPNNALFSWVNQGSATITTNANNSLTLVAPPFATLSYRLRMMTLPAAPYTVTAGFLSSAGFPVNTQSYGIVLRNSGSGLLKVIGGDVEVSGSYIVFQNWNSPTSFSASPIASKLYSNPRGPMYFRIKDDGTTNLTYSFSQDGYSFVDLATQARTTFVVPDQVGFGAWDQTNTYAHAVNVFYWNITQP